MIASASHSDTARAVGVMRRADPDAARLRPLHAGSYESGVQRSIRYMVQHQDQPVQVASLAAVANICPSHFFAVFKHVTGFTPMAFFIRLRMRRACRLLDTTGFSVKEVAAVLGYDDPFYFSRVFKSVNGLAPTDYRASEQWLRNRIREAVLPLYNGCAAMLREFEQELNPTARIAFS